MAQELPLAGHEPVTEKYPPLDPKVATAAALWIGKLFRKSVPGTELNEKGTFSFCGGQKKENVPSEFRARKRRSSLLRLTT